MPPTTPFKMLSLKTSLNLEKEIINILPSKKYTTIIIEDQILYFSKKFTKIRVVPTILNSKNLKFIQLENSEHLLIYELKDGLQHLHFFSHLKCSFEKNPVVVKLIIECISLPNFLIVLTQKLMLLFLIADLPDFSISKIAEMDLTKQFNLQKWNVKSVGKIENCPPCFYLFSEKREPLEIDFYVYHFKVFYVNQPLDSPLRDFKVIFKPAINKHCILKDLSCLVVLLESGLVVFWKIGANKILKKICKLVSNYICSDFQLNKSETMLLLRERKKIVIVSVSQLVILQNVDFDFASMDGIFRKVIWDEDEENAVLANTKSHILVFR